MDISNDHLRRELKETVREQKTTMHSMRELVSRLFESDTKVDSGAKSDLILGGFNRRRFMKIGGVSIMSAAVLAACGSDDPESSTGTTVAATPTTMATDMDVVILRTASSLERYAVALYDTAIKSGLVKTAAVGAAASLFMEQHVEHAELFEGATNAKAAGKAFTTANPAVAAMLKPRVDALKTEMDVIKLAYDVEAVAAATYLSTVGAFGDKSLNQAAMSVGGVEARHVAILGGVLKAASSPQFPADGFQTSNGAVAAGTGV